MKRLIWVLILAALLADHSHAATFYVSPGGNDTYSGRLAGANADRTDGPKATLKGARDAIRRLKAGGPLREPVQVIVMGGRYTLTEPFVLEPQDSGTKQCPITYKATDGALAVFSGGRRITDFEAAIDGTIEVRIPEVKAGKWYFEQLWVNGRRATRARTPNSFYHYMKNVRQEELEKGRAKTGATHRQTVTARHEDIEPLTRLGERELRDVLIKIYHKWDNTTRFIGAIDADDDAIVTEGRQMKSWNPWRRNTRYHLENFKAALDTPGEWFLARDGTLSYIPKVGERFLAIRMIAPSVEKFIIIAGDPAKRRYVENVKIKGLKKFRHSQYITPSGGFEASQAASPIDAVVMADGARNVTIDDCEFSHFGRYGVWFRKGCTDCSLKKCYIYDFGAGGVRIGETRMPGKENEKTARITIDNNIIRAGGRIFPCAVGVCRPQPRQQRHSQRHIRPLLYRYLRRLAMGLFRQPRQTQQHPLQSRASPRPGSPQRHGRHLHARTLRRHRRQRQYLPRHLRLLLRRLGTIHRRGQHRNNNGEQPGL